MAAIKVNCPQCGQSIAVDTDPAAAGVIQIKTRTLQNLAIIVFGALLLTAIVLGGIYLVAGKHSFTFKAYVDGTDIVRVQGTKLWIEHQQWQLPGRITINGSKWTPAWNGNISDRHSLGIMTWPIGGNVKLVPRRGRGTVSIDALPSPENQKTLSIRVDDGPYQGADWYEFTVTW